MTRPSIRVCRLLAIAAALWLAAAGEARAQLGALMSPGPLARAHASLEGLSNCQKCHEPGRRVTAERCLTCHKPIAERIARRVGVHRGVTTDCVTCHVDHAGVDGELRPFDTKTFDHAAETGFPLDGRHAMATVNCSSCHKTRSFLTLTPACGSCHDDAHKGRFGKTCERCHSAREPFAAAKAGFDHSVAAFPLTGAHRTTACTACHKSADYRVARFDSCTSCHATPHSNTVSTTCTTCHTTAGWATRTFDHSRTAFPLVGRHQTTACAACHVKPAMRVKPSSATCAACHSDPHKGGFKQDCGSCHTEKGFESAPFDHLKVTGFALELGHADLTCKACHTGFVGAPAPLAQRVADFTGLGTSCASCHVDPHDSELGSKCEGCHTVRSFALSAFTHPARPEFFVGPHATAACVKCHAPRSARDPAAPHGALPESFRAAPTTCVSCHADVHLGQVGPACETCHSITAEKFTPDRFRHQVASFALTGRHERVPCVKCHERQTGSFPSGEGTAVRLTGIRAACATCHVDAHLGQLQTTCERCHTTDSFEVKTYQHRDPPRDFFTGRHRSARCNGCHKLETGEFAAGHGTAVRFDISASCVTCHDDPHRGALGTDCGRCHRPEPVDLHAWTDANGPVSDQRRLP